MKPSWGNATEVVKSDSPHSTSKVYISETPTTATYRGEHEANAMTYSSYVEGGDSGARSYADEEIDVAVLITSEDDNLPLDKVSILIEDTFAVCCFPKLQWVS